MKLSYYFMILIFMIIFISEKYILSILMVLSSCFLNYFIKRWLLSVFLFLFLSGRFFTISFRLNRSLNFNDFLLYTKVDESFCLKNKAFFQKLTQGSRILVQFFLNILYCDISTTFEMNNTPLKSQERPKFAKQLS